MNYKISVDGKQIDLEIPHNPVEIIKPKEVAVFDQEKLICESLQNPIDSPDLQTFLQDKMNILIIVNDGSRNTPTQNVLSAIALFTMATFRLIPSFNRILYAIQNLKYGNPIVDLLYKDFTTLEEIEYKNSKVNINLENSIDIEGIRYRYLDTYKDVLNNISISIKKGQFIGFVGESGAARNDKQP